MDKELTSQLNKSGGTSSIIKRVMRLIKIPLILGILVTPTRFGLEMAGLPDYAIFPLGALWLTLGLSIYWGIKLHRERQNLLLLLLCVSIFSPISRIPIAILWWIDNQWGIGSHYGLYFHDFPSAFLNQVGYGSLIQIIPGFLLGLITISIMNRRDKTLRHILL